MRSIKKSWIIVLCLLMSCSHQEKDSISGTGSQTYQKISTEVIEEGVKLKRVMMLVKEGYQPEEIISSYHGTVEQVYEQFNGAAAYVPISALPNMQKDGRVKHIEMDKVVEVQPAQTVEWSVQSIQAPRAWSSGLTGKGVKMAVIDSGISPHDDLKIAGGISTVGYSESYYDDNGHGTHVAGLIGAKNNDIGIAGVAPDVDLYAVKALNQEGIGYLSDVIRGIDWAIQNKMDIINLSLGSENHSELLQAMVNKAYSQNILVVAASGNSGTEAGLEDNVHYPARYSSVIAVGAVDQTKERAHFSSTGEAVELAAPGVGIVSTYLHNGYAVMDGTSVASPIAAGVCALIKQSQANISNEDLRNKLHAESLDLGNEGKDPWYGFGLVQAPFPFVDIDSHWAKADILFVYDKGWMIGSAGNYFYPQRSLTRAQAAVIFSRLLALTDKGNPAPSFDDVPSNYWAKRDIDLIAQHGIMNGSAGKFSPESPLSREQMAVMLYRALKPEDQPLHQPFLDVETTRWSYKEIVTLHQLDVINGVSSNTFSPRKAIVRGQMAAMLKRAAPYFH